jgi:hypothetical protein
MIESGAERGALQNLAEFRWAFLRSTGEADGTRVLRPGSRGRSPSQTLNLSNFTHGERYGGCEIWLEFG